MPIDVATLLQFFGISALLALSPGPDNLFVLMQSAQHGWRSGIVVVVGLCLGLIAHTAAVALGLAALLAASATAFTVMKILGAAYLLWLAWGAWRAPVSVGAPAAASLPGAGAGPRPLRLLGRGIVMNVTNPKVLMFFMAFLPQFVDAGRGSVTAQIVMLGAVFAAAAFGVFSTIALFSGVFGQLLQQSARAQRLLNRAASVVFAGLAARLLMSERT